jgi:hypothetical protein
VGSESGGAVGGLCFGILSVGEGRVAFRGYVGRGEIRPKIPVAGGGGVGLAGSWLGVGELGVGGLGERVARIRNFVSSRHCGLSRAMALHVARSALGLLKIHLPNI